MDWCVEPFDEANHEPQGWAAIAHLAGIPQEPRHGSRLDRLAVVPTIGFEVLFVLIVLAHRRYGAHLRKRVRNMGIEGVLTAPWSPWQTPFVERILRSHFGHYYDWRTHLSLDVHCPEPRAAQPPARSERGPRPVRWPRRR